MAIKSLGDKVELHCESFGLTEVRRLRSQNHFHSLDLDRVDKWLSVKEAELQDDVGSETILLARKANSIARQARNIAFIAAIAAVIAAIAAIVAIKMM